MNARCRLQPLQLVVLPGVSSETFSKMSAYVLQDDIFYAELTVYETINFSAQLRYVAKRGLWCNAL